MVYNGVKLYSEADKFDNEGEMKSTWVKCKDGHVNLRDTVKGNGGKCPQCDGKVRATKAPQIGPGPK